jgi:hypothetical protein
VGIGQALEKHIVLIDSLTDNELKLTEFSACEQFAACSWCKPDCRQLFLLPLVRTASHLPFAVVWTGRSVPTEFCKGRMDADRLYLRDQRMNYKLPKTTVYILKFVKVGSK